MSIKTRSGAGEAERVVGGDNVVRFDGVGLQLATPSS